MFFFFEEYWTRRVTFNKKMFLKTLIFRILYFLKICPIFVGSVHNFERSNLIKKSWRDSNLQVKVSCAEFHQLSFFIVSNWFFVLHRNSFVWHWFLDPEQSLSNFGIIFLEWFEIVLLTLWLTAIIWMKVWPQ